MYLGFFIIASLLAVPAPAANRVYAVRLNTNQPNASTIRLPLEEYVAAVLAGECGGFRSEQALRAMAIAARTFAVRFAGRHQAEGYDFCDTTHCQDLHLGAVDSRMRNAAEATESELVWYAGAPAATFYSKHCGGFTESAGRVWADQRAPYLRAHPDPHCQGSGAWRAEVRKDEMRRALAGSGLRVAAPLDSLTISARSESGRTLRVRLAGTPLAASTLRFSVGRTLGWNLIRSDLYEVHDSGDHFVFDGRGSGHGVGLCQTGAARMGDEGRSAREILAFYYPGTACGVSAQALAWRALSGERVELLTTRPAQDQRIIGVAERLVRVVEERCRLPFPLRPHVKVFPTVATFRDSTGEPGWVAASTRGATIRLQPWASLPLESTLRHELFHVLIQTRARADLPLWFREGLVEYLMPNQRPKGRSPRAKVAAPPDRAFLAPRSRAEMEAAYRAALARVEDLVDAFGEARVLASLEHGLP